MREAAHALRSVNIEPVMAEAVAARQDRGGNLKLLEHFGGKDPLDYQIVVRTINANMK